MDQPVKTLTFRPATLDDAAFAADVETAVHPSAPADPLITRYEWETAMDNWSPERFVVARYGTPIGVAFCEHPEWSEVDRHWAWIGGEVLPDARDALGQVLAAMEERATGQGATLLRAWAREDDAFRIETILGRGFREDRRGKWWELDLAAKRADLLAMTEASRERMRREGIRLLTLDADRDPERYRKIWRMSEEAADDVPRTVPRVEDTLDNYLRWLRAPNVREERVWIAREGDAIVGISLLGYPPVRGVVTTEWTATARSVRGRGVARALKCETVAQAIGLGVERVQTSNDAKNDPILHLNETMGYHEIPGNVQFLKDA